MQVTQLRGIGRCVEARDCDPLWGVPNRVARLVVAVLPDCLFGLEQEDALGARIGERIRGLDWKSLASDERVAVSRDMEVFYPENRYLNFYVVPLSNAQPD